MTCGDCHHLRALFDRIKRRNLNVLNDYQLAILGGDEQKIAELRVDLREAESILRELHLKLLSHIASHEQKAALAAGGMSGS